MPADEDRKDEPLFFHLVSTFTQSAWIALGKIKNPVTDKTERHLEEASLYIDLLDMIKNRMRGNLSGEEQKFLDSSLSGLKLNYVEEVKRAEEEEKPKTEEQKESKDESKSEAEGKDAVRGKEKSKNREKTG